MLGLMGLWWWGLISGAWLKTGPLVGRTSDKRTDGHHSHENEGQACFRFEASSQRTLRCRVSIEGLCVILAGMLMCPLIGYLNVYLGIRSWWMRVLITSIHHKDHSERELFFINPLSSSFILWSSP
jgi:hypothetical protein